MLCCDSYTLRRFGLRLRPSGAASLSSGAKGQSSFLWPFPGPSVLPSHAADSVCVGRTQPAPPGPSPHPSPRAWPSSPTCHLLPPVSPLGSSFQGRHEVSHLPGSSVQRLTPCVGETHTHHPRAVGRRSERTLKMSTEPRAEPMAPGRISRLGHASCVLFGGPGREGEALQHQGDPREPG